MNTKLMPLLLTLVLGASSCGLSEDGDSKEFPLCPHSLSPNLAISDAAYLSFDPSLIFGKKVRIYDGAMLVIDTCSATPLNTAPLSYQLDTVSLPGRTQLIVYFYDQPLPTSTTMQLLTASDCASAFVPAGTASFNYDFQEQQQGFGACSTISKNAVQEILFQ